MSSSTEHRLAIHCGAAGQAAFLDGQLPAGSPRKVLLKPNWVKHEESGEFPIRALVTDSALIDAVIQACLRKYPELESLIVGDVPLQSCEWDCLIRQAGIDRLMEKYRDHSSPTIQFIDLRRERWRSRDGFLEQDPQHAGDPAGYAEVVLDEASLLEPISDQAHRFRVSDYDPGITTSMHARGSHRYLIARSVLEADLVINLPKMKTHQKAGITGALKNLVGINGSKAHLVHHRLGLPSSGGDEFPESVSRLVYLQVRLRELLQKRSKTLFRLVRLPWQAIKRLGGVETVGTRDRLAGRFYVGSGSWHGNDSIWRMIYDLNLIVLHAEKQGGSLRETPQRQYLAILDGMIASEGNGPLQPLPVECNLLVASSNPFLVDMAMAKLMGYDYRRIPTLANHRQFPRALWAEFDPHSFLVQRDGACKPCGVDGISSLRPFIPPPGWKGHIELVIA